MPAKEFSAFLWIDWLKKRLSFFPSSYEAKLNFPKASCNFVTQLNRLFKYWWIDSNHLGNELHDRQQPKFVSINWKFESVIKLTSRNKKSFREAFRLWKKIFYCFISTFFQLQLKVNLKTLKVSSVTFSFCSIFKIHERRIQRLEKFRSCWNFFWLGVETLKLNESRKTSFTEFKYWIKFCFTFQFLLIQEHYRSV